ncbi:DUF6161 domain-containing protein [Ketobacter sp.]|uniref:DUF6161 domain-containing protein n=1 Tax=Ketobacter sp. TaxID=2083498 RepID=UPI000F1B7C97|nr:DUF6161 domain-containing protein [Ketobacter sp.]RLU00983.1 MAG: hypothetical protein D9N14_04375 [Ketobacter sp.]
MSNVTFEEALSVGGIERHFVDMQAVLGFVKQEQDFLIACDAMAISFEGTNPNKLINQIHSEANHYLKAEDIETKERHFDKVKNLLRGYRCPLSESEEGHFLKRLSQEHQQYAKHAFQYFIRGLNIPEEDYKRIAAARTAAFKYRDHDPSGLTESALTDLVRHEMETLRSALNHTLDLKGQAYRTHELVLKQKAEHKKQFNGAMESFREELEAEKKKYREEIAEKEAVDYWNAKAKTHNRRIKWYVVTIVLLAALFFFSGYELFDFFREAIVNETSSKNRELIFSQDGQIRHWVLLFTASAAMIVIWLIRIAVRLLFSNIHLAEDAKERATLIQTYLAMERYESVLKPEDKELILPSIFRPSSDGIVKDDAAPPSMLTMFNRTPK